MPGSSTSAPSDRLAMPSAPQSRAGSQAACSPWTELEDHLKSARRSILAEIRNYPPPIAACDQQFNYLLEQRDRIASVLRRLASIRRASSAAKTDLKALIDFIHASDCIPDGLKGHINQLLSRRSGGPS